MRFEIPFNQLPDEIRELARGMFMPAKCEKELDDQSRIVRYICHYIHQGETYHRGIYEPDSKGNWISVQVKESKKCIGKIYYKCNLADITEEVAQLISLGPVLHVILVDGRQVITTNGTIELDAE